MNLAHILTKLESEGNLRELPHDRIDSVLDFTSNDYLGLGNNPQLIKDFLNTESQELSFSSSASRLLASKQDAYNRLEALLEENYGRPALLFNSGYHANSGIIPALASAGKCLILADRLVHASIIDGIILSRAEFRRFPHNDIMSLNNLVEKYYKDFDNILIITESIFSMDGDEAPLEKILSVKRNFPNVILYVDEAHAFGVRGPRGLGLAQTTSAPHEWDIIVGTFGKAAASMGAYAVCSEDTRKFLINKSRSLIFSTALPPVQIAWTDFVVKRILEMDKERAHLNFLGEKLAATLDTVCGKQTVHSTHIQPLIIGNPHKAVYLSERLLENGIKAMAIRTPTVPVGTERLRFSLSASMTEADIIRLGTALKNLYET